MELQDLAGEVTGIAWNPKRPQAPTIPLEFVAGGSDCSVCLWRVVKDVQCVCIEMVRGSFASRLVLTGAVMNQVLPPHTIEDTKREKNQTSASNEGEDKDSTSMRRAAE